jgi:GAF domain-containing protein
MTTNGLPDPATSTVLDLAHGLLADLDPEAVLSRVVESARELSGAEYAALGVLDDEQQELERFITSGVDDTTRTAIGAPPHGKGVLGLLIQTPEPLRLADVGEHPGAAGFPAGHPRMKSFLGVPITVAGKPVGNLYLADKAGGEQFTEADEAALVILAQFAGVAIDHARTYAGSEARRANLERTVDALNAALQIAEPGEGEANLDATLQLIAVRGQAQRWTRAMVIERLLDGKRRLLAVLSE